MKTLKLRDAAESDEFNQFQEILLLPILHEQLFKTIGLDSSFCSGILLSGPPGVGKTRAVKRIAEKIKELNINARVFTVEPKYSGIKEAIDQVYFEAFGFLFSHTHLKPRQINKSQTPKITNRSGKDVGFETPPMATESTFSFKSFSEELHRNHREKSPFTKSSDAYALAEEQLSEVDISNFQCRARAIIFIDELDIRSVTASLLAYLDGEFSSEFLHTLKELKTSNFNVLPTKSVGGTGKHLHLSRKLLDLVKKSIIVVGATNLVNEVDPALRRPGRFDKEIKFKPPTAALRKHILVKLVKNHFNNSSFYINMSGKDYEILAQSTVGFVGADLIRLVLDCRKEVLSSSLHGSFEDSNRLEVNFKAFEKILSHINVPASQRALSLKVEKLKFNFHNNSAIEVDEALWARIAGYDDVKLQLTQSAIWPVKYASQLEKFNIRPPKGILLYGPPGCAKTTFAKTLATIMSTNFISLDISEVYCSPYFGESEKKIREVFDTARLAVPSIIFIDEIDSILTNRFNKGSTGGGNQDVSRRILSTLLNEMDGVEESNGLTILGATNRFENIDKALLRPGRFDVKIQIKLPSEFERFCILRLFLEKMVLGDDIIRTFAVNLTETGSRKTEIEFKILKETNPVLQQILKDTDTFSGADLENLCKESGIAALRQDLEKVSLEIFVESLKTFNKS